MWIYLIVSETTELKSNVKKVLRALHVLTNSLSPLRVCAALLLQSTEGYFNASVLGGATDPLGTHTPLPWSATQKHKSDQMREKSFAWYRALGCKWLWLIAAFRHPVWLKRGGVIGRKAWAAGAKEKGWTVTSSSFIRKVQCVICILDKMMSISSCIYTTNDSRYSC